ncbi:MAG: hypothetical protein PHY54_15660 [Methylococcales bacterium]|nr:hypothetical protein [Methylococcales bacterium]
MTLESGFNANLLTLRNNAAENPRARTAAGPLMATYDPSEKGETGDVGRDDAATCTRMLWQCPSKMAAKSSLP